MPEPSTVIKAIDSMCEIPLIGFPLVLESFEINVPKASGSKVFLIQIGIFEFRTGCIVGGYKTLAPK